MWWGWDRLVVCWCFDVRFFSLDRLESRAENGLFAHSSNSIFYISNRFHKGKVRYGLCRTLIGSLAF